MSIHRYVKMDKNKLDTCYPKVYRFDIYHYKVHSSKYATAKSAKLLISIIDENTTLFLSSPPLPFPTTSNASHGRPPHLSLHPGALPPSHHLYMSSSSPVRSSATCLLHCIRWRHLRSSGFSLSSSLRATSHRSPWMESFSSSSPTWFGDLLRLRHQIWHPS